MRLLHKIKWNTIKILALAKRSIQIMVSYRLAFVSSFVSPLLWVFMFGMFGRVFQGIEIPALAAYGGDYVAYILLGTIFWQFVSIGLDTTASEIQSEAEIGTIEAIFMTPTNVAVVFPGVSLVSLVLTAFFTIITVAFGVSLFHFNIGGGNYLLAALIVLLTYLSTLGIGMIIAGLTILYKNIGAVVGMFITVMMFLSGVYFPVSVLPGFLQKVAAVIPLTYSLHGIRMALLQDASIAMVATPIAILGALSVITIGWGYFLFKIAINRARREGTLGYY